ncbi:MAG: class I SAM-dependent methyltransferase [Pseudomonadota bacterium]|nr:class I SAM-dependent methyltransferase [Pseudomonadota bacterium]
MDAEHEFADRAYVRKWAETADQRRPERARMFRRIIELLQALDGDRPCIVELGCGPGTLAQNVLGRIEQATYEGFDFSWPMLELARERLAAFGTRAHVHQADLRGTEWVKLLNLPVDAVITNQALHDLGSADNVASIYNTAHSLLRPKGLFINAELVVPEGGAANKPGKLPLAHHIALLEKSGFVHVRSDLAFGEYVGIVAERSEVQAS